MGARLLTEDVDLMSFNILFRIILGMLSEIFEDASHSTIVNMIHISLSTDNAKPSFCPSENRHAAPTK